MEDLMDKINQCTFYFKNWKNIVFWPSFPLLNLVSSKGCRNLKVHKSKKVSWESHEIFFNDSIQKIGKVILSSDFYRPKIFNTLENWQESIISFVLGFLEHHFRTRNPFRVASVYRYSLTRELSPLVFFTL